MIDEAYDRAFQGARTPLYRSLRQLLVRPKIEDAGPDGVSHPRPAVSRIPR